MKKKRSMIHAAFLAAMALVCYGCNSKEAAGPAPSAEATTSVVFAEGIPGGIITDTLTVDAEVVKINHKARTATLLLPDDEKLPVEVGPEAVNFDQVQKGDRVSAVVIEELAVYVGDEDSAGSDGTTVVAARAEKGAQPGGMAAEITRITATVTAIDLEEHAATLQFEDGNAVMVDVRPDVELSEQNVGAKVVFEISRVVAISVDKQE